MTTSERSPGGPDVSAAERENVGAPDPSLDVAGAFGKELQRFANELFAGRPPSALASVGAGGASPAVTLPPVPGPVARPPIPNANAPTESDLRPIHTLAHEHFGIPLVTRSEPSAEPYFLQSAGIPTAVPGASPAIPSAAQPPSAPSFGGLPAGFTVPSAFDATTPSIPGSAPSGMPALPSSAAVPPAPAAPPHAPAVSGGVPSSDLFSFSPEVTPDLRSSGELFDPHAVKKDFPILQERVHGRPLVWLDNAATTQKPHAVIERLSYFYQHENSNVHRAAHTLAARSTDAYEAARDKVRRFLNASSPKDIVFARGATEAINLVAQSWGRRHVGPGDEIVITWLEHHANVVPWQLLAAEKGARLRVAPVDDNGEVRLDAYEKLLGPKTRIVSLTHVSNALGTVVPAQEMVHMAHRHGARVLVDGAQAVSHMPVDVQALDCDFYVFSGHKVFAPTGIGALYGKPEVLETMPPWQGGGNMIADVTFEKTLYQPAPARFEAGTGNIADAVGLGAAIDYVTGLGLPAIHRYEHELRCYGEELLRGVPGLRIIGNAREKAGVISFVLDGVRTEDVGGLLDKEGIAVRSGHHCAQPILRRMGLESTVRASLAPYNTREDLDALAAAVHRLQVGRPR